MRSWSVAMGYGTVPPGPYGPGPSDVSQWPQPDPTAFDQTAFDPDAFDPGAFDPGAADLADRVSLRRVEGIRTDLADISEVEYRALRLERVILVGIASGRATRAEVDRSFAELQLLAETAGSHVLAAVMQTRAVPDPATYLGRGKVAELADLVRQAGADTVIFDQELSPAQLRNLEDKLGVKVVDRTAVILDIFAQHAKSKEGQAQVELAQLTYRRQRLRGWGDALSRQVGGRAAGGAGIGGRGPGETKLETDRRRITTRIARLRSELKQMAAARQVKRAQRVRRQVPAVAIVGYTNAGKSSLLNAITQAQVLVDDSLFATLDPTTRQARTESGRVYTLTDTVGFIRHLPTHLIEAFASTLEESLNADLLVHLVDAADPDPVGQLEAVHQVLGDIGADTIDELVVLNKVDLIDEATAAGWRSRFPAAVLVSVRTGQGMAELAAQIEARLPGADRIEVLVPYERGDLVDRLHRQARLDAVEHLSGGTRVVARVDPALRAALADYEIVAEQGLRDHDA